MHSKHRICEDCAIIPRKMMFRIICKAKKKDFYQMVKMTIWKML
ncbi:MULTISPECIES: 50S ribosomal protein L36 [unclassified Arcicella]